MNREILLIFAFLVLVPASVNADELDDYIEHVREVRMEAMAEMQVQTIASILAGYSTLTYRRDEASGQYWPRFAVQLARALTRIQTSFSASRRSAMPDWMNWCSSCTVSLT